MSRYKWVIVWAAGIAVVARIILSIVSIADTVPTVAQAGDLPVIIIDPGHGGIDGGAVGVDGIVEKDINLEICLVLQDLFRANGFEVVMTRTTDISIHDEAVTGTKNQKTSDLHNRLAIAQEYPGAIFLSIHQNKFGDSSSKGAQIFYSPNNPDSKQLAELLQVGIIAELQPDNKREIKQAGKNLYLMTQAQCTAVLLECGFLSNSGEAYQLMDKEYQAKIAFVAFESVMRHLELDQPVATVEVYF